MIGSATSATTISGVLNASNVSTTVLNATNAFIGTKTIDPTFNYGPSFVDANTTVSGNEFSVTVINDYSYKYSNTPIPMDLFNKGSRFQVTITARGPQGSWISVLSQNGGSDLIYLTSVMTTYRKVLTVNSVPSSGNMIIYGNGTITWSTIMFEPYSLSVNGGVDVSGTLTVSGPATVTSLKTKEYTSNLFNYAPTFTKTLVGGTLAITNGVSQFTLSGNSGSVVSTVPVLFRANTKYTVTLTAYGDSSTTMYLIIADSGFLFMLSTTSTAQTKILTMPSTDTTSMSLFIYGTATKKVSWSNLTIEPYYDMTIGSNTLSVAGDVNVSSGAPITGWATNRIITSSTGITMGTTSSIVYGNGTWVMVGLTGTVLTSKNEGVTWTSTQVGSTTSISRGCAFGNGIFVLNTSEEPGINYTSENGSSWTLRNNITGRGINWTTFGNGIFVGVSETNNIYSSSNGTIWTTNYFPGKWYGVIYGNNIFVACGKNEVAKGNAEGTSWTRISLTGEWKSIAYGNGIYMVASWEPRGGFIATSVDATTWTRVYTFGDTITTLIYHDNAWFAANSTASYISYNNGVTWTNTGIGALSSMASGNGKILGGNIDNQVFFTKRTAKTDGTSITSDTIVIGGEGTTLNIGSDTISIGGQGLNTMTIGGQGTKLNIVSDRLNISSDILNVSTGAATTVFTSSSSSTSLESRYGAYGNGIFVVAEDNGGNSRILTTTTGLSASLVAAPTTTLLRGLAYGLINGIGTFMLTTYATPSQIWLSTNGTSWTLQTPVNTMTLIHSIAYGNGVFMVGCQGTTNNVGYTIDGKNWTNVKTPSSNAIGFMLFGAMSTGDNVFLGFGVNYSCRTIDNGSNWNVITIPNGDWWTAAFGNDVFIAVDNHASNSSIIVSRNGGQTWSTPTSYGLKLSRPIYVDNTWYIGSTGNITMFSKDNALTWEKKYTGFHTKLFLYGNDKLLSLTADKLTLVNAKSRRSDGTNLTYDTITIGQEGSKLLIGNKNYQYASMTVNTQSDNIRDGIAIYANTTESMAFIMCLNTAGTSIGSIGNNGGTGLLYNTTSDRRLKTNIRPMTNMLDTIMKLKPSTYNWASNQTLETNGFIAQEVFELLPVMRTNQYNANGNIEEPCDENGNPLYYGLDYGTFTPYIVKAIQEMKTEYDSTLQAEKQKVADLQRSLSSVLERLAALEQR